MSAGKSACCDPTSEDLVIIRAKMDGPVELRGPYEEEQVRIAGALFGQARTMIIVDDADIERRSKVPPGMARIRSFRLRSSGVAVIDAPHNPLWDFMEHAEAMRELDRRKAEEPERYAREIAAWTFPPDDEAMRQSRMIVHVVNEQRAAKAAAYAQKCREFEAECEKARSEGISPPYWLHPSAVAEQSADEAAA